jgi:hypothetical protein
MGGAWEARSHTQPANQSGVLCEILRDTVRLKLLANEDRADFTIAANHRFLIVHGG